MTVSALPEMPFRKGLCRRVSDVFLPISHCVVVVVVKQHVAVSFKKAAKPILEIPPLWLRAIQG